MMVANLLHPNTLRRGEPPVEELGGQHLGEPSALRVVRTLVRRKWVVVATTVVTTGAAIALSMHQQALYSSSAQVLLKYQNLASGLTGIPDPSGGNQDPARIAQTQSLVAMSPAVAQRVVLRAHVPGLSSGAFLKVSTVRASSNADVLDFSTTYGDAATAERLVTLHASEYIAYRQQLDNAALVAARRQLETRIAKLRARALGDSDLVASLVEDDQQLRTMEALQTANSSLLRAADSAAKVQPRPVKDATLGIVLGLLLGIGLAFARDALDTRIGNAGEIGERLGIPMLARVSAPPKKLRSSNELAMLVDPHSSSGEAFRIFRTNLDFVNLDRGARSIMITSALEQEGKSTTVANLALALARAGSRVALVDLDLRRPSIGRFFGIDESHPGVTSVAVGSATLSEALVEVFRTTGADWNTNGSRSHLGPNGVVKVLVAGQTPSDPGEFITNALAVVLEELSEHFDLVLIDTPPLLSVGDAMALATRVDAMVVVARLRFIKRPTLRELARALHMCATVKLGYVATGAELEEGYGDMGYGYYGYRRRLYGSTLETEKEASIV
jgi:Mrp family chromosome partitioning ATPase/capsular polysaccharide biosynthesis protein